MTILAAQTRPAEGRSYVTLLSMMILVGIEVFAVALSGGWAIAGLFELGDVVGYVLMAAFSIFAAWIMLQLWRRATGLDVGR